MPGSSSYPNAHFYGNAHEERWTQEREPQTGADTGRKGAPVMDQQLDDWIAEARHKAKEMLQFTVEETSNILKEGMNSALAYLIIPSVMAIIGFLLVGTRSCSSSER